MAEVLEDISRMPGTIAILTPESNKAADLFQTKTDFGQEVTAGPLPAWARNEDFIRDSGRFYDDELRDAKYAFLMPYECEAIGQPHPTLSETTLQDAAYNTMRLLNMSLWIAKPTSIGIGFVIHTAVGRGSSLRRVEVVDPVMGHEQHVRNVLTAQDVVEGRCIFSRLPDVPKTSALWNSVRFLLKTLPEVWWEGRYLTTWVALEALFGPESPSETTFRLCQRLAFFLSQKDSDRLPTFQKAKKLYEWRCKLVHGRSIKSLSGSTSLDVSFEAEEMLRLALHKILLDAELSQKFSSKARDVYLDNLVFSTTESTPHPDALPPAGDEGR